jgi:hypothetical protein
MEEASMKRPLSQAAFDAANPEGAAYLASDILEKRTASALKDDRGWRKIHGLRGCGLCVSPERSI